MRRIAEEQQRLKEEQKRIKEENEKKIYNSLLDQYKSLKKRRLKQTFVHYTNSLIPAILAANLVIWYDDLFDNNVIFTSSIALTILFSMPIFVIFSLMSALLIVVLSRQLRSDELAISKEMMPLDKTLADKIKTSSPAPKFFWTTLILAFFMIYFNTKG